MREHEVSLNVSVGCRTSAIETLSIDLGCLRGEFKLYFEMPNQQGDTNRFVFRTMADINAENRFAELGS